MPVARSALMLVALWLGSVCAWGAALSVGGAPVNTGYNTGSPATIRATLNGVTGAGRYEVFADVRYAGSNSSSTVELRPRSDNAGGPERAYEGAWPIPADAATGLYTVALRAQDAGNHAVLASAQAPGFFVYRKLLRITHVALDKAFYAPGERIQCEIGIENLTARDLKGLRIEFSNENYPWISTFSGQANAAGRMAVNPALGLVVLRESLDIPARGQTSLPMAPAGRAAFLEGSQVAIMGAGGPARHEELAPPETDRYTIAVWDHDRTHLLDMQFSPQVIVREPDRVLPKPYDRNFTHPYNREVDFAKYREFYEPGQISPIITIDRFRTLYRPGDHVSVIATVPATLTGDFHIQVRDPAGKQVHAEDQNDVEIEASGEVQLEDVWPIPANAEPGVYSLTLSERNPESKEWARATIEIAVNPLPPSLMVFCPHEDDEHPFAGLMRAMFEAGLPVHVVFYTGGPRPRSRVRHRAHGRVHGGARAPRHQARTDQLPRPAGRGLGRNLVPPHSTRRPVPFGLPGGRSRAV
jgi:hypothetical protein